MAQQVVKYLPKNSKDFVDIYAMESQVRNHREWVQGKAKELKVTKMILRPILNESRQNDFQFYEFINANLSIMAAAHKNILSNAKTEKKIIIRVQKNKRLDIESKITGKEKTLDSSLLLSIMQLLKGSCPMKNRSQKLKKQLKKGIWNWF